MITILKFYVVSRATNQKLFMLSRWCRQPWLLCRPGVAFFSTLFQTLWVVKDFSMPNARWCQMEAAWASGYGTTLEIGRSWVQVLWPFSWKSQKLFGPEKPFVKLRTANSTKLGVSYVVKGKQLKKIAKFRASRRLCFEDTKRIMSPETRPISFRTFEKQVPALTTS